MASAYDVLINFVGRDSASAVANKTATSVQGVAKAGDTANKSIGGFGATLKGIGAAVVASGIITVGKAIFDAGISATATANKFDNVRKSLQLMTGSTQAGNDLYRVMEDLAARTPFTFDDIAQGTQKLLAMGFAAKDIPALMTTIGDASSALGAGAEGVDRISRALGQMQAKGKITTEEMMQLQEMGIPAFRLLAEASGVSQQALMEMVSKGIIPADQNLQTLINAMQGEYGGMMATQMNTATQAQSNFQDASDKATAAIGRLIEPGVIAFYNNLGGAVSWAANAIEAYRIAAENTRRSDWYGLQTTYEQTQAYTDRTNAIKYGNQQNGAMTAAYVQATDATKNSTSALKINESAIKSSTSSTKSYRDVQKDLIMANRRLRDSFFDIAAAQRNVKTTREALEDATNPRTLEEYEIAADRAYYSNELLNNEITRMKNRQTQVRAALEKGNLTQEERNDLIAEDAQITEDLIGKQLDARQSVIDLEKAQKALDRARDPARVQEYYDEYEQAKIRVQDLTQDQGFLRDSTVKLTEAVSGNTTEFYKNIVAVNENKAALRDADSAINGLTIKTARNSAELMNALPAYANYTSAMTTQKDEAVKLNQAYTDIGTSTKNASTGIKSFSEAQAQGQENMDKYRQKIIELKTPIAELAKAFAQINTTNFTANEFDIAAMVKPIAKRLATEKLGAFAEDDEISQDEYNLVKNRLIRGGLSASEARSFIEEVAGKLGATITVPSESRSVTPTRPAMGGITAVGRPDRIPTTTPSDGRGIWSGANVTITLNYASPPDSKNPLADVEDYINAQGGLVRV